MVATHHENAAEYCKVEEGAGADEENGRSVIVLGCRQGMHQSRRRARCDPTSLGTGAPVGSGPAGSTRSGRK